MMKQQIKVFLVLLPNTQNHRETTKVALSISPFLVLDDNTRISGDPKHTNKIPERITLPLHECLGKFA